MSKTEKLKLREIEVLNDNELKTRSIYAYSGSGSGNGSGSGSGSGVGSGKDECRTNSDCGSGRLCVSVSSGFLGMSTIKKCRDMNNVERSCEGKSLCDDCRSYSNNGSYVFTGKCSKLGYSGILFCKEGMCTKN